MFKELFFSPVSSSKQRLIIVLVAALFIFVPQWQPVDWNLNTDGFWADIPHTYINTDYVYPPWALILLIPYRLMQAEGARFLSVLVVGWLVIQQKWSLSKFLAIVLSPYFLVTMAKSNLDILALVFPLLLWRAADGTKWQNIAWGLALSILLVKPQGAVFIGLYLLWISRRRLKELLLPAGMVAIITVPISLVGSPPLLVQWLNNIQNPSSEYAYYWSVNNVSLTARFSLPGAALILMAAALALLLLVRFKKLAWTNNHTIAALLFVSMFTSPYASQQVVSSAFAFIPSWGAFFLQTAGLTAALSASLFYDFVPLWVLLFAFGSFLLFAPTAAPGPAQPAGD